jgi:hypothetical protein
MSSERALVALNIESYDLLSSDCVEEIKKAKTIAVIAENDNDERTLMKNIIHLLNNKMGSTVVMLTYPGTNIYYFDELFITYSLNSLYDIYDNINNVVIIVKIWLTIDERNELRSKFSKVIYPNHRHLYSDFDQLIDITFVCLFEKQEPYYYNFLGINKTRISYEKFNVAYNACVNNYDVMLINDNSIKICKIEYPTTYIDCYHQYDSSVILQTIVNIANNKCVFYKKNNNLYDILWKKYYFITKCINVRLTITRFMEHFKDILNIIIHFMVTIFVNDMDVYMPIYQSIIYACDMLRYSN